MPDADLKQIVLQAVLAECDGGWWLTDPNWLGATLHEIGGENLRDFAYRIAERIAKDVRVDRNP